jgi:SAM-dependent methyltransferase
MPALTTHQAALAPKSTRMSFWDPQVQNHVTFVVSIDNRRFVKPSIPLGATFWDRRVRATAYEAHGSRLIRTFARRTSPPLTLAGWLRHDVIRRLLSRLHDVKTVLEIGAGEGALGVRLASAYDYVGVEPSPPANARARARVEQLGRGTIVSTLAELDRDRRFDLVCAFEVLEHIADERAALALWRERLRSGGWLLVSVAAGEQRFGPADEHVGHYRRYEPDRLEELLREEGFEVQRRERVGLPLGYALESLRHVVARFSRPEATKGARTAASGSWLQPPQSLGWLTRMVTSPFRALEHLLPASRPGTNLIVLAKQATRPHDLAETS